MVTLHIPENVYFNPEHGNFYSALTGRGMGGAFWQSWHTWRNYFPHKSTPHNSEDFTDG